MAVFKSFDDEELIVTCHCGCDETIKFSITKDFDDEYAVMSFMKNNYYTEQENSFLRKLKKIWCILRNKDYFYSDVRMTKEEFEKFKEWLNRK